VGEVDEYGYLSKDCDNKDRRGHENKGNTNKEGEDKEQIIEKEECISDQIQEWFGTVPEILSPQVLL
jgi:hypothetical protein